MNQLPQPPAETWEKLNTWQLLPDTEKNNGDTFFIVKSTIVFSIVAG